MSWLEEVRKRLKSPAPARLDAHEGRRAAVLVPLYVDSGELWVLLTRRTDDLPHHRSQVAFPGGGLESGETAWEAARRETNEELGIAAERVVHLGELDEVEVPSGYRIVPCVGAIPFPVKVEPNPDEIAETFSIPLSALANPLVVEQRRVEIDDLVRDLIVYHVGRHRIWGMTAAVLHNLLDRLGLQNSLG